VNLLLIQKKAGEIIPHGESKWTGLASKWNQPPSQSFSQQPFSESRRLASEFRASQTQPQPQALFGGHGDWNKDWNKPKNDNSSDQPGGYAKGQHKGEQNPHNSHRGDSTTHTEKNKHRGSTPHTESSDWQQPRKYY